MPGPRRAPEQGELDHGPALLFGVERTPIMRLARTLNNRAWQAGAYGAIYRANLRIVQEVQERAAANLKGSIVRPEQSTGNLEQAIRDVRAVYASATKMIVGVGEFLDIKASYWRAVEQGAPGLAGKIAYGYWTRAPRSARGKVALEGPLSGERSGRPIILSWDAPPEGIPMFSQNGRRNFFTWSIEHPTQAHWYFANAWNEVGQSGFMEQTYRDEFRQALGPNGKPIVLGRAFRAYHGRPLLGSDFRF